MSEDIQRTLGRIESKLDGVLERQSEQHDRLNKHGDKIASLERWRAWVLGAAAVVIFGLGFAAKLIK
jgi:hypothetical protein